MPSIDNDSMDPERRLDATIEASFPASDPPANTPQTGIRLRPGPEDDAEDTGELHPRDNLQAHRFELDIGGQTAFLQYQRKGRDLVLVHTEVPPAFRGRGFAGVLTMAALAAAAREHLRVVVVCPFVRAFLKKHPEITLPG